MLNASSTPRSTGRAATVEPALLGAPPEEAVTDERTGSPADATAPDDVDAKLAEQVRRIVEPMLRAQRDGIFAALRKLGVLDEGGSGTRRSALERLRDAHAAELARLRTEHEREKDELVVEVAAATRNAIMSGRKP